VLRGIDRFLDLTELRQHLADYYSHTGWPSIDPELMIRMLIIGYCFGIRSERRLCEDVHLLFRITPASPRTGMVAFQRCMTEGLVRGEGFATDASIIRADAHKQRGVPGEAPIDWGNPEEVARPVREYLAALDDASTLATPPKAIALTDPASTWTAAGGPAIYAYATNYLVDLKAGIIVDVEASRRDVRPQAETPGGGHQLRFGRHAGWMVDEKHIEPHVPVFDKSERDDGTFSRSDFEWDEQRNEYRCPAGKVLRPRQRNFKKLPTLVTHGDRINYRASKLDCEPCPLKQHCCPTTPVRKITHSIHEAARDVARRIAGTDAYKQSRKDRKKVEMLFAHLKRILKLDRLRLRGMSGARDEFLLAATAQNLLRMGKLLGQPPPTQGVIAPA